MFISNFLVILMHFNVGMARRTSICKGISISKCSSECRRYATCTRNDFRQKWLLFFSILPSCRSFWTRSELLQLETLYVIAYHSIIISFFVSASAKLAFSSLLQAQDILPRGSRIKLDIKADSPVIVLPMSSHSPELIVMNLGKLVVNNSFLFAGSPGSISVLSHHHHHPVVSWLVVPISHVTQGRKIMQLLLRYLYPSAQYDHPNLASPGSLIFIKCSLRIGYIRAYMLFMIAPAEVLWIL